MKSARTTSSFFRGAIALSALLAALSCRATARAQDKFLTIENNSDLPLKVYVDERAGRPVNCIGFVDPVSRTTFDRALQIGRWYVTIEPYAPNTKIKPLAFTLYVKTDRNAYVYEIMDKDFGPGPILPPENVSIAGRWNSGPWGNFVGMVVEFTRKDDGYVGRIVSCSNQVLLERLGYYVGMELITGLKRTDFYRYRGFIRELRRDGTFENNNFMVSIDNGRTLFPYGWTRAE